MAVLESTTSIRTLDGLHLAGTVTQPTESGSALAVLVHGGGVTRHEAGFFDRLAASLAEVGVTSLRFDLPGHGESEGRLEELTLASVLNAIRAAIEHLRQFADRPGAAASLIGASFSGGITAYYAANRAADVDRLVLFNPLLDYKDRFVDQKPFWRDDYLTDAAGRELMENGYLPHSPTFRLGRPLLNEVFWFDARAALCNITAPTLLVHGSKDTFIPIDSSRRAAATLGDRCRFVELEGAQHGIAVHDDPTYADPQTQAWQAQIIGEVQRWLGPPTLIPDTVKRR